MSMNSLLFTFDSRKKQFSTPSSMETIQKPSISPEASSFKNIKKQHTIRTFRTKKLRRYQNVLDNFELLLEKTGGQEEISLAHNMVSQNLVKLSNLDQPNIVFSSQTIQEKPRFTLQNKNVNSMTLDKLQHPSRMSLNTKKQGIKTYDSDRNNIESILQRRRKRSASLKDTPMVDYSKNKNKLPQVFRLKSKQLKSTSPKKQTIQQSQQSIPKREIVSAQNIHTKIVRKISGNRMMLAVPKIQNIEKAKSLYRQEKTHKIKLNEEDEQDEAPNTPAFNRKDFQI